MSDLATLETQSAMAWAAYRTTPSAYNKQRHFHILGMLVTARNQAAFAAKIKKAGTASGWGGKK